MHWISFYWWRFSVGDALDKKCLCCKWKKFDIIFPILQKITVNGNKQFPFLLWTVNKQSLFEKFRDEMYHAALNVRLRIMHEQEQAKEVRFQELIL